MLTTPEKVFRIPELAHLVLCYLDSKHLVPSLTTSKMIFSAMVPHVWETVTGAAPLFQFLSCEISNEYIDIYGTSHPGSFVFKVPLSEANFGRFNFYAPYVKHLDLFKHENDLKITLGWEVLIDYVNAGHTLLPNLMTLSLQPPHGITCWNILPYPWALVLCSTTLDSISISGYLEEISPRVGSGLGYLLARRCPNLTTLEFELMPDEMEAEQDKYIPAQAHKTDYIPDLLQPNSSIRRFQMRNLQSLEVREIEWDSIISQPLLPPDPFPALTAFAVSGPDVMKARWLCEHMPALFTGLTKLECTTGSTPYYGMRRGHVLGFPLHLATVLNDKSPNITDLTLHFDPCGYYIELGFLYISEHTLSLLAQLPLRKLSVQSIMLCCPEARSTKFACRILAASFPNLEVLKWMSQPAACDDLCTFAEMPNLRHLGLYRIAKLDATAEPTLEGLATGPRPKAQLRILESYISPGGWLPDVEYIARLWPNIRIIPVQCEVSEPDFEKVDITRVQDSSLLATEFAWLNEPVVP